MSDYRAVGDVLGTLMIAPMPENTIPCEAVVLIAGVDPEGHLAWYSRYTAGLTHIEAVGALTIMLRLAEGEAVAAYLGDDDAA